MRRERSTATRRTTPRRESETRAGIPNPLVDPLFANASRWRAELGLLRHVALRSGLSEERKWGVACYTVGGKNVAIIHGFKEYCALSFFKGVLLADPRRLLTRQTTNVQAGRQLRFTKAAEIRKLRPHLAAYLREAIAVERAGTPVRYKVTVEFRKPAELTRRLREDPAFRSAFRALTPGRQRGYILYFAGAKRPSTREARIAGAAPRILQGRGIHD